MKKNLLVLFTGLFAASTGFCQINIPANSLVKENFNAIGSTTTATLPAGWKMSSYGTGLASGYTTGTNVTATTQAASSGTPTAGGRYNWATAAGADRAIGFMTSLSPVDGNAIFADYKNTTGATVTSVNISFNVERYRINTGSASVAFFSSTDGSTWTARPAGDISAAVFIPGASSYTFANPQTVYKNITISGISILNNSDIYFRWVFTTGGTNSQGLGLDDVVLFAPPAAPVVTGSMRDNLQVDNNADNQAGAGDQLRYTTVVRNKGTADATGVNFNNLTPANTTFNAGSVKTSALARDDNYSTPINTPIPQSAGVSVLTLDFGLPSLTVVSFGPVSDPSATAPGGNGKSDNGGTVIMNADGTFSYAPPTGFTGNDRFSYIVTTGTAPDNAAVVTIAVGSSVITTGFAESYNVTGNVSIITPTSGVGNLLNNDTGNGIAIGSVNGNVAGVGVPVTTANGGTLTVNSDGSFTYNPAPGYEGPDNFTYTVDNGFSTPSAPVTVTLTVAGMIWFIDRGYSGTLTDGRLGSPFKDIATFQGVNNGGGNNPAVNDNIFIYENPGDYVGSITLLNGQKLIGQDATGTLSAISGISFPLYTDPALPSTNSANGTIVRLTTIAALTNAITLQAGASNTVRGLTIGNTSGAKLFNTTSFNTLTIGDNALPDVTLSGSGQAMFLSSGTFGASSGFVSVASLGSGSGVPDISLSNIAGTVDFGSTNISATQQGIVVTGSSAAIDFGNTVVNAGGDGITFQSNPGANIKTFGTLSITTSGAFSSFSYLNGGAVTAGVTSISNGTGNGIDITNNAAAVTFGATTVTKSGAGNAINIANTASSNGNITFGGVTLGTAGTRLTGPAINIVNTGGTNTSVYDFGAVSIFTNAATGIIATNVDGTINTSSGTVDATGAAALNISGPAGLTTLGMTLTAVNSNGGTNNVNFTNCAGSATLNGGSLTGTVAGTTFNVTGGTLGLTYSGGITQATNAAMVGVNGGHNAGTVTFQTGALNATFGPGLQFDNADGTYNFTGPITLSGGDAGIDIINGSAGNFTFANAPITNPSGVAFNVNGGGGVIAHTGVISKTSAGRLIDIQSRTGGSVTINSNLSSTTSSTGINVSSCTGGTVTFNGGTKTISTGTINGVNLATNTGSIINFANGGLAITTTSGTGFNATGGGTVNVSGTGNNITSTGGVALNWSAVSGTAETFNNITSSTGNAIVIATSGATPFTFNDVLSTTGTAVNINTATGAFSFHKISSTGATKGIIVNSLTGTGSFTVTATGGSGFCDATHLGASDCSGGNIWNSVNRGAEFTNSNNINLKNIYFKGNGTTAVVCQDDVAAGSNTACNAAIHLTSSNTVTLDHIYVDGTGSNDMGILGNAVSALTATNVEVANFTNIAKTPVDMQNLSGTCPFTNLNVHNNNSIHTVFVTQNTGTSNISFVSPVIQTGGGANNPDALQVDSYNNANVTVSATGVTIANVPGNGVSFQQNGSSTMNATLNGGTVTGTNGILMQQTGTNCVFNFTVTNLSNVATHNLGSNAITVGKANGTNAVYTGTVSNNVITSATCGGGCNGITVNSYGVSGSSIANITGNNISGVDASGIVVVGGQGGSSLTATIQNNNLHNPVAANTSYAVDVIAGTQNGDAVCFALNLGDMTPGHTVPANRNVITGSWQSGGHPIEAGIFNNCFFKLLNYPNPNTTDANAASWISASNGGLLTDAFHAGPNLFIAGAACP